LTPPARRRARRRAVRPPGAGAGRRLRRRRAAAAAARGAGAAARPGHELRGDGPRARHAGQHAEIPLHRRPASAARPALRAGLEFRGGRAMNCPQARALLPLLAYGDLPPDEADALARHLADCPACQGESAGLAQVRQALDAVPAPRVSVDVSRLFAEAADRRARRWRRIAFGGAALAAGLLLAFGLKLQVRAGNGQVVITWGT